MVLCDAHVPSGGLVRDGRLLLDFHSFPLRIMEVPDRPQEAILKVGFSDGIYGRSKGGLTFSGWKCEHLPYLVEIDNWGASRQPGKAKAGGIWVWGYDEITWFAHQSKQYRSRLAALRLGLGAADGPQRPSPDARQPHDAIAAGQQAMVLRQHAQPGSPRRAGRRGGDSRHLGSRLGKAVSSNTNCRSSDMSPRFEPVAVYLGLTAILLAAMLWNSTDAKAAEASTTFAGEKTAWHGFDRYDFLMDEATLAIKPFKAAPDERYRSQGPPKGQRRCIVVVPKDGGARQPVVLARLLLGPRAPGRGRAAQPGFSRRLHHARPRQDVGRLVHVSSPRSTGCPRSRRSSA